MIWVGGEHDITTRAHLSRIIARASRLDDVDILVDLSDVTFMDASTIGAIVDAHNRLRARSHLLSLRAPSARARRLLDVCELGFLIDEAPAPAAPALDTWVAVPASERADAARPPVTEPAPSQETVEAAAERAGEPAGSAPQPRAPS